MIRGLPVASPPAMRIPALLVPLVLLATLPLAPPAEAGEADEEARRAVYAALDPESRLVLRFLEHLGWRVEAVPNATVPEVWEGRPAERENLDGAIAAGDLRLRVPPALDGPALEAFRALLPRVADGTASRLAWRHRVAYATRAATAKLAEATARGRYTFPKVLFVDSPFFRMEPPEPEWECGRRLCRARGSAARAVEAVYVRDTVAECYVAQWLAVFAIQYELYGAEWFDESFRGDEIVVGRPQDVRGTPLGRFLTAEHSQGYRALLAPPERHRDDLLLVLGEHGPGAFPGATGVVENQFEGQNSNDNFVVVSISPRALALLRQRGGTRWLNEHLKAAWDLWVKARRDWVRGDPGTEGRREVAEFMTDPVFDEWILYVHPYGVVPLRKIVEQRFGRVNTPVTVRLYDNGLDDALFRRYREAFTRRVREGREP